MSWFISFSLADLFVLLMAACRHQMRRFVRQLFFLKKTQRCCIQKVRILLFASTKCIN